MSQEESKGNELRHATTVTLAPPPSNALVGRKPGASLRTKEEEGRGGEGGGEDRKEGGRRKKRKRGGKWKIAEKDHPRTAQDAGVVTLRRKGWVLGMVLKAAEGKGWGASLCEWMLLDSCSV